MTDKSKEFLLRKFKDGARSGYKADPVQLAKEMKVVRNEEGYLVFMPEEWRSSQQINSLFSRLTAVQRQRGIREEDVMKEDVVAIQSEVARETPRTIVMNDMAMATHPIVVGSNNICELVSSSKLHSLKLVVLRAIC